MTLTSTLEKKPSKATKEIISSIIDNHAEGVLCTVNPDGTPSSSVVTLHTFAPYHYFFMTKDTTKKYDNLEMNPNVSFLIFDPFSRSELEIKGVTEFIWDARTRKRALKIIDHDKTKGRHHSSPYVSENDAHALYSIHPETIHFTTFWDKGNGAKIYEEMLVFTLEDSDYAA